MCVRTRPRFTFITLDGFWCAVWSCAQERERGTGTEWADEVEEEKANGTIVFHPVGEKCMECGDVAAAFPKKAYAQLCDEHDTDDAVKQEVSDVRLALRAGRVSFEPESIDENQGMALDVYRKWSVLNMRELLSVIKQLKWKKVPKSLLHGIPIMSMPSDEHQGALETVYLFPRIKDYTFRVAKLSSFQVGLTKRTPVLKSAKHIRRDQAVELLRLRHRATHSKFKLDAAIKQLFKSWGVEAETNTDVATITLDQFISTCVAAKADADNCEEDAEDDLGELPGAVQIEGLVGAQPGAATVGRSGAGGSLAPDDDDVDADDSVSHADSAVSAAADIPEDETLGTLTNLLRARMYTRAAALQSLVLRAHGSHPPLTRALAAIIGQTLVHHTRDSSWLYMRVCALVAARCVHHARVDSTGA